MATKSEVRFNLPTTGPEAPVRIKPGKTQVYWVTHPQRGEYGAHHKSHDKLNEGSAGFETLRDSLACIERWRKLEKED